MCEKFSHWFTSPEQKELDKRDLAVASFAQTLLIRTLSDSFAAVAASGINDKGRSPAGDLLDDPAKLLAMKRAQRAAAVEAGNKSKSVPPGEVHAKHRRHLRVNGKTGVAPTQGMNGSSIPVSVFQA